MQQRAKASQQQPRRQYSTNQESMCKRVYRNEGILSPSKPKAILKKNAKFPPAVQATFANKGITAVKQYLVDKLVVAVEVSGMLHQEKGSRKMCTTPKLGFESENKIRLKLSKPVPFLD